ncbi:MAG: hypothetical protein ACRDPW_00310, partial [Mycobacteriales bacterium]
PGLIPNLPTLLRRWQIASEWQDRAIAAYPELAALEQQEAQALRDMQEKTRDLPRPETIWQLLRNEVKTQVGDELVKDTAGTRAAFPLQYRIPELDAITHVLRPDAGGSTRLFVRMSGLPECSALTMLELDPAPSDIAWPKRLLVSGAFASYVQVLEHGGSTFETGHDFSSRVHRPWARC